MCLCSPSACCKRVRGRGCCSTPTDSFLTLKELLTKHKTAVAEHLERNFDDVFAKYRNLLLSQSYVARRQLLRLLGELLGDRCNFKFMTRLIADVDLLKVQAMLAFFS
jgi:calcium binding protein 39